MQMASLAVVLHQRNGAQGQGHGCVTNIEWNWMSMCTVPSTCTIARECHRCGSQWLPYLSAISRRQTWKLASTCQKVKKKTNIIHNH